MTVFNLKHKRTIRVLNSFLLLLLLAAFSASSLYAGERALFDNEDDFVEVFERGEINWEKGLIRVTGIAGEIKEKSSPRNIAVDSLGRLRSAKIAAMRNLLEIVKEMRVDFNSTGKDYIAGSEHIGKTIQQIIRKAKIVEKIEQSGGGIQVIVELPLRDQLLATMVPETGRIKVPSGGEEEYTGLIIDAGGLGVKPALSPRIIDERGREIYGASYVNREYFLSKGIVVYSRDQARAAQNSRVAGNPLVVRALRTSGAASVNLVISDDDASKIRSPSNSLKWMEECRVIIIVDR